VSPASRPEPLSEPVHAALDPLGTPTADLVAQRVGERLDRLRPTHRVAIDVEEVVELAQRQGAVAPEDGEARRSQSAPPQRVMIAGEQGEGSLVVGRWSASLVGRDDGPELAAELLEPIDELDPLGREREQVRIELGQPAERIVAVDVKADALVAIQVGGPSVGRQAVALGGVRHAGHGIDPR